MDRKENHLEFKKIKFNLVIFRTCPQLSDNTHSFRHIDHLSKWWQRIINILIALYSEIFIINEDENTTHLWERTKVVFWHTHLKKWKFNELLNSRSQKHKMEKLHRKQRISTANLWKYFKTYLTRLTKRKETKLKCIYNIYKLYLYASIFEILDTMLFHKNIIGQHTNKGIAILNEL